LFAPFREANANLIDAKKSLKVNVTKWTGKRKRDNSDVAVQVCMKLEKVQKAVAAAQDLMDKVVQRLRETMSALPDTHPLMLQLQDPCWLQALPFTLPLSQIDDCSSKPEHRSLYLELCETWQHYGECCTRCSSLYDELRAICDKVAAASEWQQQTDAHARFVAKCSQLEDEVDEALELLSDADTAWLLLRDQVNAACGFFVHTTTAKNPRLLRPKLSPSKLSMTVAKKLLSQACQGVVQEDLLKEFVPLERRWIEGLHLTLNTGNAAYEHARNTLHYLLLPDGTCRNLNGTETAADS
jgi:hypothetical protein